MKINRDAAVKILVDSHAGFQRHWDEHLEFWEGDEPGITNDFSVYVGYVVDLVLSENLIELAVASEVIERLIVEGNEDVQYGATIGYLEGITNSLSHKEDKHTSLFNNYLKPKSREFCVELDKFWGTNRLDV